MFDNPSAGKWEAPPPPKDPLDRTPLHKRWWFGVVLASAVYGARYWLRLPAGKAALGAFAPLFGIAVLIVYHAISWRTREPKDGDPYSPPTRITR